MRLGATRRIRETRRRFGLGMLLVCLVALAWVAFPGEVGARAGGGHSFSRSSSSSSGSRSYSSGSSRSYGSRSYGSGRSSSYSYGSSSSSSSGGGWGPRPKGGIWDEIDRWAHRTFILGILLAAVSGLSYFVESQLPWLAERAGVLAISGAVSSGASFMVMLVPELIFAMVPVSLILIGSMVWEQLPSFDGLLHAASPPVRGPIVTPRPVDHRRLRASLDALRLRDPSFSRPLFLDFVGLLYARVVRARRTGAVEPVRGHVAESLVAAWASGKAGRVASVDELAVGAISLQEVRGMEGVRVRAVVRLEGTWVELPEGGATGTRYFVAERWVLGRNQGVLSRGPRPTDRLGCPKCGAADPLTPEGRCTYCDQVVNRGDFDWQLEKIDELERTKVGDQDALLSGGEEEGTELPTLIQPGLGRQSSMLRARHLDFSWSEFEDFVRETFVKVQEAWSAGDLAALRALETNSLWTTHQYWILRYQHEGLANRLEQVEVKRLVHAHVEQDAFYESITLRIFARMIDCTRDRGGRVRSGSPDTPRYFSEYWTFIASVGAPLTRAAPLVRCPACGADMALAQTGQCGHCQAVVGAGRFGWVLSRIEQDEAYAG